MDMAEIIAVITCWTVAGLLVAIAFGLMCDIGRGQLVRVRKDNHNG